MHALFLPPIRAIPPPQRPPAMSPRAPGSPRAPQRARTDLSPPGALPGALADRLSSRPCELVVRGWNPRPSAAQRVAPCAPAPPRRAPGRPRTPLPLQPALAPAPATLERALHGESDAWGAVLGPLHARLVALAARRLPRDLGVRLDPEDLVQEAYLHVLHQGERFEPRGSTSVLGWVLRVLQNTVADQVRHHRRQRRDPEREAGAVLDHEPLDERESGASPLALLLRAEEHESFGCALGALPLAERQLLEERFGAGRSFAAIAQERGWSETTARRRLGALVDRLQLELA